MRISDWMVQSGVGFGTSGARGLVHELTDAVCFAYTVGFLRYLSQAGLWRSGQDVMVAMDLRPSSPRLAAACLRAVKAEGGRPRFMGAVPTPALAACAFELRCPSLMITGSHIPVDRNGIKFYCPEREVLKSDEAGIAAQEVVLPVGLCNPQGAFVVAADLPPVDPLAGRHYVERFAQFFPPGCLEGLRVGLYEHSSVGRDLFSVVLRGLGAQVTGLGRSDVFVSVDTEAIRAEDIQLGRGWAREGHFDALISADGDADRPLIGDAQGEWLRGDVVGILVARALGAGAVVTPISSNTALERSGWFPTLRRTRIGSPYVIEALQGLVAECGSGQQVDPVVGYEANGGFLQATPIIQDGRELKALPTRDALIVAVTLLRELRRTGIPLAQQVAALPSRFTHSDRLQHVASAESRRRLAHLNPGGTGSESDALQHFFGAVLGEVVAVDTLDGLRVTSAQGEILHIRPSGNAPELRVYSEADTSARAIALNQQCIALLSSWRHG